MPNRRKIRSRFKVIHRHRIGQHEFRRVSELIYVKGRPKAILGWISLGNVRTPIYQHDLDPDKLRKAAAIPNTYYYDGVTVDPRYINVEPATDRAPPPSGA